MQAERQSNPIKSYEKVGSILHRKRADQQTFYLSTSKALLRKMRFNIELL